MQLPFGLVPGTLIVFEGIDGTGKSTQLEQFRKAVYEPADAADSLYEPKPLFTHQPSGASGIGPDIYKLTESIDWRQADPLTRQLLHLAAHNEHYRHDVVPALDERAVFMDRSWMSTVAYGYRGSVKDRFPTIASFIEYCLIPTGGVLPNIVFYFEHQHDDSDKKAAADRVTKANYEAVLKWLEWNTDTQLIRVPDKGKGEVTAFISAILFRNKHVEVSM